MDYELEYAGDKYVRVDTAMESIAALQSRLLAAETALREIMEAVYAKCSCSLTTDQKVSGDLMAGIMQGHRCCAAIANKYFTEHGNDGSRTGRN